MGIGRETDDVAVFQIPNPADQGTPDSANAVVRVSIEPPSSLEDTIQQVASRVTVVTKLPQEQSEADAFLMSRANQGETTYIVVDRIARRGVLELHLRVAWPLLPGSTVAWEEALLSAVNDLTQATTIDGQSIGRIGQLVVHTHTRDDTPMRLIEVEE